MAAGLVVTAAAVLADALGQPIHIPLIGVSAGIAAMLALRWVERRFVASGHVRASSFARLA